MLYANIYSKKNKSICYGVDRERNILPINEAPKMHSVFISSSPSLQSGYSLFGIANQVEQKMITLSPEILTLVELAVVLSLDNRLLTLAWLVARTVSNCIKLLKTAHSIEANGIWKTGIKIALFALMIHQVSAMALEVNTHVKQCIGLNQAIQPPLDCFKAGRKTAECTALVDDRYPNEIYAITRHSYGPSTLVVTDPKSTFACFFTGINKTDYMTRTCFPDLNNLTLGRVDLMPPVKLGEFYNQLKNDSSMIHVVMKPLWPWEGDPCAFIHKRPADFDLGRTPACILMDPLNEGKFLQLCFNPTDPIAVTMRMPQRVIYDSKYEGQPNAFVISNPADYCMDTGSTS